jgi:hypothetical protein
MNRLEKLEKFLELVMSEDTQDGCKCYVCVEGRKLIEEREK